MCCVSEIAMTIRYRIKRKLYKLSHPELGRILMLHRVVVHRSEGENRELEITPDFLEQTIKEYKQKGFRFVSIDEVSEILEKGRVDKPFVCITFDDGYRDNYTDALPILKKEQVPFTVYVTTGFIDNKQSMWWYPNERLGLSRDELLNLDAEPLCTICAHTITHPKLENLSVQEQRVEIKQSKQDLESLLGHSVAHFSYPHGSYNDDTIGIIKECGFRTGLMAWGGVVRKGDDALQLHRIELRQS